MIQFKCFLFFPILFVSLFLFYFALVKCFCTLFFSLLLALSVQNFYLMLLLYLLGFLGGSAGKESACNTGDLGLIPGLGTSPGEEKGYPLHYSDLENSMDCIVHGVAKSWTRLSNFTHSLYL